MEKNNEYRYIEYAMNEETKKFLFQPQKNDHQNPDSIYISRFLYELTLINPNDEEFYNLVGDLKQRYHINLRWDSSSWSYQIQNNRIQFTVGLFAKYVSTEEHQTLFSEKRLGKCHEKTLPYFQKGNQLVTGYITDIVNSRFKTLHTWLEQSLGNKMYVMDYVMNVVMEKEIYYQLMGVDVKNILTEPDTIDTFQQTFLIPGKLYCMVGKEIADEIRQKVKLM